MQSAEYLEVFPRARRRPRRHRRAGRPSDAGAHLPGLAGARPGRACRGSSSLGDGLSAGRSRRARGCRFPIPPADGLIGWYRAGAATLDEVLVGAPDDLQAWTLFAAPTREDLLVPPASARNRDPPRRRRVGRRPDAQLPDRVRPRRHRRAVERVPGPAAVDPARRPVPPPAHRPDGRGRWWHLTIDSVGRSTRSTGDQDADTVVRGSASDLYLYLWNREPREAVDVDGDHAGARAVARAGPDLSASRPVRDRR